MGTLGEQVMNVWNCHYACTGHHRLLVFNQFEDVQLCAPRPGNVHSADGRDGVLKPVVTRYPSTVSRIYIRGEAGFANADVHEFLKAERIEYAIRLPANQVLQNNIGYLLKCLVGRAPNEVRRFCANFSDQAGSRTKLRLLRLPKSNGIRASLFRALASSLAICRAWSPNRSLLEY